MRMIEFRGVLIPAPPPIVQLSCEPGFTGRVVVELKDGEFVKQYPVRKEEMFCSFETLLEIAKKAGYQVIPPTPEINRADSYTNS
ncbi:hypothetical protein ACU6ZY_20295 [Klebsiella aerogenes]